MCFLKTCISCVTVLANLLVNHSLKNFHTSKSWWIALWPPCLSEGKQGQAIQVCFQKGTDLQGRKRLRGILRCPSEGLVHLQREDSHCLPRLLIPLSDSCSFVLYMSQTCISGWNPRWILILSVKSVILVPVFAGLYFKYWIISISYHHKFIFHFTLLPRRKRI